ncbi:malate/lactate/ureidoglycolate dehydrogenase [Belnapia sp. T6]|uniref:Malate/lactate/ureidoglycolate dehydrogenase n=1 Tax=Belnapia mucosa TaxID=2804532 RepID=A0ABS1UX74_9PROT|nr:malate/lactate/ureidoglycolate dehydrogenase [Belnapia mucosa]MBL6454059.1 malate/lactate/ureidoglycolate dehydrogenase [Belnapia mucosa]
MLIQAERLQTAIVEMLQAAGTAPASATIVAADLLEANLQGHDSHGVQLAPRYVLNVLAGKLAPNAAIQVARRDGAIIVADGGMGFGQVVGRQAMDLAIASARDTGLGLLALRNVHHLGRIGAYGDQAVAAGMLSIHFVNAVSGPPVVAPFGGSEARFGTNPICIAIPPVAAGGYPLILDFATSAIAIGKVRVAHAAGRPVPEGSLVDRSGRPTTDPGAMYGDGPRGALLPFGLHKGSGLALMCEILAGALTGGGTNQPATPKDRGIVNGMFALVLDPARFGDIEAFRAETAAMVAHVKTAAPGAEHPVLVAGEKERITKAERQRDGIPVPGPTWTELCGAAAEVGIPVDCLAAIAGV